MKGANMAILDGMISSEEELKSAMKFASELSTNALREMGPNERTQSILDLMNEGLSLGDILGVTKEQRDALLNLAIGFIKSNEIQKAQDVLLKLIQLEPLDERANYVMATTYQLAGDFATAGKLYVQFLALDATNPEGYIRLGECFLGAGELDDALASFETASRFAAQGKGRPGLKEQADRLAAVVTERQSAGHA
jgi:tetratricopeptide (TPR) repeat protein